MKYLRKFNTEAERDAWLGSDNYISPNVVLTEDVVEYNIMPNYLLLPLYIEAIDECAVGHTNPTTIKYSVDKVTWHSMSNSTPPVLSKGQKLYFLSSSIMTGGIDGNGKFTTTGKCNIGGNIMSMVWGENFIGKTDFNGWELCYFRSIFSGCNVVDASRLKLPAISLGERTYQFMFRDCIDLIKAPEELPATTLGKYCYGGMFYGCTSLKIAPKELPATTLAYGCYSYSDGKIPATRYGMFQNCSSLEVAPELPADILVTEAYNGMFRYCSNLKYIKMMATDISASSSLSNWVQGVAQDGVFVKNTAATWDTTGGSGIPSGWTVELAES